MHKKAIKFVSSKIDYLNSNIENTLNLDMQEFSQEQRQVANSMLKKWQKDLEMYLYLLQFLESKGD